MPFSGCCFAFPLFAQFLRGFYITNVHLSLLLRFPFNAQFHDSLKSEGVCLSTMFMKVLGATELERVAYTLSKFVLQSVGGRGEGLADENVYEK